MELWNDIQEKQNLLDKAINELASNGYELAKKEKDYKIALNKKALILRDERNGSNVDSTGNLWLRRNCNIKI